MKAIMKKEVTINFVPLQGYKSVMATRKQLALYINGAIGIIFTTLQT